MMAVQACNPDIYSEFRPQTDGMLAEGLELAAQVLTPDELIAFSSCFLVADTTTIEDLADDYCMEVSEVRDFLVEAANKYIQACKTNGRTDLITEDMALLFPDFAEKQEIIEHIKSNSYDAETLERLGELYAKNTDTIELGFYFLGTALMLDDGNERLARRVSELADVLGIEYDLETHFPVVEQHIQDLLNEGISFTVELGVDGFVNAEEVASQQNSKRNNTGPLDGEILLPTDPDPFTNPAAGEEHYIVPWDEIPEGGALSVRFNKDAPDGAGIEIETVSRQDYQDMAPPVPE